ncbi:putative toxin-antitoxin system toxin component, PIN family [Polynucleobacter victoriensis]|uniref:Putative toxin-antitoxin system toxin component, PIN family n=1 Tax=Polynucleobacter victoriensis TaxID=2049319 RepID=A0A212TDN2_9BURK|nr:putative toxin-antitoxin system toxin component, PIN family [Polynucleobacter victoriensis]SNC63944.1 putative toxin-antitoxin system toxin component, PIN family [Polynucleobacter victoriensis]
MKPVVVLDTNILLDVLVFDDSRAHPLRAALMAGSLDAVATQKTLAEFLDVIGRQQFLLSQEKQDEIMFQWRSWSRLINDEVLDIAPWKCKDRDDQVFINLAYTLKPAMLISKDKMVLKIAKRAQKDGVVITSDHNRVFSDDFSLKTAEL